MSQQPKKVGNRQYDKVPLDNGKGKKLLGKDGKPIMTREYHFEGNHGGAIIQEHSIGHRQYGGDASKPHFNVRPMNNPRSK